MLLLLLLLIIVVVVIVVVVVVVIAVVIYRFRYDTVFNTEMQRIDGNAQCPLQAPAHHVGSFCLALQKQ